ncbi:MAG: class I SAM-dependent methyltransferase [Candidatus Methylomirabilales bacterium]
MGPVDRWTKKKGIEPTVESYLRSIGIGEYQDRKVFWEGLREKHGPIAEQVAHAISAREEGEDVDVYPLKNASLALSIDLTSQYCNQIYRAFLSWFCREGFPAPSSVLDLGCDSGILTCFYAMRYPEAEVVGVDRCELGVACARELADRLHIANVRFEVCDLQSLEGSFPEEAFDLMLSTTVFHEVLRFPEDLLESWGGSIGGVKMGSEDSNSVRTVTELVKLLCDETGMFVSMERCPDAEALAWWIRLLNQAGLKMDANRSALLSYHSLYGERETLPILVATRSWDPATDSGDETLALRMYSEREEDATDR